MFYRENGQFKTSYRADQQIFPDLRRIAGRALIILAFAFLGVPLLAERLPVRAISDPVPDHVARGHRREHPGRLLRPDLAGLGSLHGRGRLCRLQLLRARRGHAADPVPGAGRPAAAAAFGILFGLPSLRVKGLYLAVATLAAQFFSDWMFLRIKWFTNDAPSGSVSVSGMQVLGLPIDTPITKYLLCLSVLVVLALLAKNLVRSAIGREWMAIRDMDVAAAVIGIRPMYAKLTAFAVSSFIVGVAGALWGFVYLGSWEPAAFSVDLSFRLLFMVIIGGMGSIMGCFFGAGFIVILPIFLNRTLPGAGWPAGHRGVHGGHLACRTDGVWCADRVVPDRGTPWPGQVVVYRQAEAAPVAVPALIFTAGSFSSTHGMRVPITQETFMKIRNIVLAGVLAATAATGAFAQAKEQFFPGLPYRTGAYAPNGVPWANGYADYLKLVNARGGINGVKILYEECETGL
jgi:branched-chain amino acid transport system permease protein